MFVLIGVFFGSTFSAQAKAPDIGPFPPLKFEVPEPQVQALVSGTSAFILEDHELPLFSVTARVRTGSLYDPPGQVGLCDIFAQVLREGGTRRRTPGELNRELEFMAASLDANSDREQMTVSISALSKDFDQAMDIFQDVLLNPAFRRKALSLVKAKTLEGIRRRNDDPGSVAIRYFRKSFYGADHPRGREPEVWTVRNIKKKDLAGFYQRYFQKGQFIFSVSGDVQFRAVVSRLNAMLGRFPGPQGESLPSLPLPAPTPGIGLVHREINQSRIVMGQLGIKRHDKGHFAMEVANYVIGGGAASHLWTEVRSRQGLAYSVGSFSNESMELGVVGASCETKSESTVQAVRSIRETLSQMAGTGPAPEELTFAKDSLVNSFVFEFTSPTQIANTYARLAYEGYPEGYLRTYTQNLMSVTAPQMLEMVHSYWRPERMTVMVVGDETKFQEKLDSLGSVKRIPLSP